MAVCNLASIALNRFVTPEGKFDFKNLFEVTKVVTRNLNRIIDINFYPVPEVTFNAVMCSMQILNVFSRPECRICDIDPLALVFKVLPMLSF